MLLFYLWVFLIIVHTTYLNMFFSLLYEPKMEVWYVRVFSTIDSQKAFPTQNLRRKLISGVMSIYTETPELF